MAAMLISSQKLTPKISQTINSQLQHFSLINNEVLITHRALLILSGAW